MKIIKNIIEYLIAISVIPAIVLSVISVTELKDVKTVQFELLSEEGGVFYVTPNTYNKLMENKKIKSYDIESNYPLITREEMDRATWGIDDELKNEIYIDENGQKRIKLYVGKVTFDGSESWVGKLQGELVTRYRLSENHPIYINYTNNYIVSDDRYLKTTHIRLNIDEFQIAFHEDGYIYIGIPNSELGTQTINEYLSQNPITITYELADKQSRLVEVYDFSTFRLVYNKNSIKVLFDIDDGYYLWEITNDDVMIPINGQYDIGGVWTVKYYIYEIQQPIIRTLVLLVPLIVIGGLLIYQYDLLKKKGLSN